MRLILLTDVDDSLMQTARKCADGDLTVGALDSKGSASSFMTAKQRRLWAILETAADIRVPVTARSRKALGRVQLEFKSEAVCDFGATVVNADGALDSAWLDVMLAETQKLRQAECFAALHQAVTQARDVLKTETRVAEGVPVFLNVRVAPGEAHALLKADVLRMLRLWDAQSSYYLHCTDRDVTVLPRFITKTAAVRHLVESRGWAGDLVVGLGDSLSDAGFMAAADYLLAPGQSRLAQCLTDAVRERGEHP